MRWSITGAELICRADSTSLTMSTSDVTGWVRFVPVRFCLIWTSANIRLLIRCNLVWYSYVGSYKMCSGLLTFCLLSAQHSQHFRFIMRFTTNSSFRSLLPEERVYREERVSLRFPDTPHEFVDVQGLLVWSPPGEKHRSYHISYRKDDTGLYVYLEREKRCRFTDPLHTFGIKCEDTLSFECTCENGREVCMELGEMPIGLSPGLLASLAGK